MESKALRQSEARLAARPVQLVLVRANAPLFYSLAAASLLEVGTPLAADRLLCFFGCDGVFAEWVRREWLPHKLGRAQLIRQYVQTTWPEYDWFAGHDQYRAMVSDGPIARGATAAHEALSRCVAAGSRPVQPIRTPRPCAA